MPEKNIHQKTLEKLSKLLEKYAKHNKDSVESPSILELQSRNSTLAAMNKTVILSNIRKMIDNGLQDSSLAKKALLDINDFLNEKLAGEEVSILLDYRRDCSAFSSAIGLFTKGPFDKEKSHGQLFREEALSLINDALNINRPVP